MTLLGFPVPPMPWYTTVTVALLALLGLALAWTLGRLLLQGLFRAVRSLLVPLFRWAEPYTGTLLSTYGQAHWARQFEIARAGLFRTDGLPLGTWQGKALHEPTGGHIALIGPPRSRKSWGLVMPAIESYSGSVVISDLRGELHDRTYTTRVQVGKVWRYDPAGRTSCHLNVLDSVAWGQPEAFADVHRICHHFLLPLGEDKGTPFDRAAVGLLVAAVFHCRHQGEGHFPGVLAWLTDPATSMADKLKALLSSADPVVRAGARRLLDQSERLRSSVWSAALEKLVLFADPLVSQHSQASDVTFAQLTDGLAPSTIYLCFGFQDISRLGPLLGCLVEALIAHLGRSRTAPRHTVLLALDELANLGRLAELERAVSYLQGAGGQVLMTCQNVTQLLQVYGPNSPLLASCGTKVYYTANDVLTAMAMSQHAGETTVLAASTGTAGDGVSWSRTDAARPLLTVDEALRLGDDQAVLYVQGCAPIKATKLGAPPRAASLGTVALALRPWRPVLVPGVACLVLGLALWPLTWPASPARTTGPLQPVTAAVPPRPPADHGTTPLVPPPPAQTGAWVLHQSDADLRGKPVLLTRGRYATADACTTALHTELETILHMVEHAQPPMQGTVTRTPDKITWETVLPRQKPTVRSAWCTEAPAARRD